jgi:hypothetical protein
MARRWVLVLVVPLVLGLAGCAAGANPQAGAGPDPAGFWLGLWQGLILPVTFVASLFNDDVGIYEVANRGHLYDLGFLLGAGGLSLPGFLSKSRGGRRG